jgi:hypothetical protein
MSVNLPPLRGGKGKRLYPDILLKGDPEIIEATVHLNRHRILRDLLSGSLQEF